MLRFQTASLFIFSFAYRNVYIFFLDKHPNTLYVEVAHGGHLGFYEVNIQEDFQSI